MKKTEKILAVLLAAAPATGLQAADVRFIDSTSGTTAEFVSNVRKVVFNMPKIEVTTSEGNTVIVERSVFDCLTIGRYSTTTSVETRHDAGITFVIKGNTLTVKSSGVIDRIELITPDGRTAVISEGRQGQAELYLGSCDKGIYIVKAVSGMSTVTRKIMIQ